MLNSFEMKVFYNKYTASYGITCVKLIKIIF